MQILHGICYNERVQEMLSITDAINPVTAHLLQADLRAAEIKAGFAAERGIYEIHNSRKEYGGHAVPEGCGHPEAGQAG